MVPAKLPYDSQFLTRINFLGLERERNLVNPYWSLVRSTSFIIKKEIMLVNGDIFIFFLFLIFSFSFFPILFYHQSVWFQTLIQSDFHYCWAGGFPPSFGGAVPPRPRPPRKPPRPLPPLMPLVIPRMSIIIIAIGLFAPRIAPKPIPPLPRPGMHFRLAATVSYRPLKRDSLRCFARIALSMFSNSM